jgi:hypothetical protein
MTLRSALHPLDFARLLPTFGLCILACAPAFAQADKKPSNPPVNQPANQKETTLKGCLSGGPADFDIAATAGSSNGKSYTLTGRTSELTKYVGYEISVQGIEDDSTVPQLSFEVHKLVEVFKTPGPHLAATFMKPAAWTLGVGQSYGIVYAVPPNFSKQDVSQSTLQPNFVAEHKPVTINSLQIPREIYPGSNFVGGAFAIYVDPAITNQPSCQQFGLSDPRFLSSPTFGRVKFKEMIESGAATGTAYTDYYFHAFQNGLCYEIAFEFAEFSTANVDTGCTIPQLGQTDELNLIDPVMNKVSFLRPADGIAVPDHPDTVPSVTSFVASSQTADGALNRGQITFSWSTQNTDYVRFSYRCSSNSSKGIVISEDNAGGRECENLAPIINSTSISNHSPNSSAGILFGNFHQEEPLSIVVTITPFSHGVAHPDSSKSITIAVNPYNPFPQGVPLAVRNMTVLYAANPDGTSQFVQGSPLTITWTDALPRDPCVDLYLIQEIAGKQLYRTQLGGACLTPTASGSYAWTIPTKFSGSAFRIYARTPGGTSSAYGPPFAIIQPNPAQK